MPYVRDDENFRKLLGSSPVEAIERLYNLHKNTLFKISFYLTRDENAAKDIVHDAFVLIHVKHRKLSVRHVKAIENYMVRVVRNKSISYFKRKRHLDVDDVVFLLSYKGSDDGVEEQIIQTELILEMRRQILSFPRRERECLLMKIDREMSLDQIAGELGISRKMVEKNQTKSLKRLKKWAGTIK